MKLKEIINQVLIDTKTIDITVYHILISVAIILAAWIFVKVLRRVIERQVRNRKIDKGTGHSLILIAKYLLWVIVIGLILETVGIKITLLIAGSAALLVGLGLGIQQIFNDIVSGFFMLFERNLKVGDVVELEDHMVGRVEDISLRTSKIRTRDNIITIVPNHKFINENVVNWSHIEEKTRFHVNVGVAYGSDVNLVESVLLKVAGSHKDISRDPEPFVRFLDFAESSLNFQLFFWTNNSFYVENIKSDLRFKIDKAFRENKVTIPFPQRDVHLKKEE